MKFSKNKSFRAIVLTRKKLTVILCCIILAIILICLSGSRQPVQTSNQYTSGDDFHNIIVAGELHTEKADKENLKKLISSLLGFDPENPETILYDFSSQFYEVKEYINQAEVIYPQPGENEKTEPQSVPAEEKPIEEISASKGMSVSNSTNLTVDTNALINSPLPYTIDAEGPQILIVHTHTTESYTDSEKNKYSASDSDRNTDENKNMIAVGAALAEVLNKNGIPTIHDTTVHDYPAYNGSYNRSKATVLANLEKYPSIKIVLDVHRDGIVRADGTKIKVACDINGAKASQCMFVVGSNVLLQNDGWEENMKLACKLQNIANELYPGFMRPINLREERFNQQLSKGSLIIEVGSNGNTLNESIYAAKLMGNVISKLFGK